MERKLDGQFNAHLVKSIGLGVGAMLLLLVVLSLPAAVVFFTPLDNSALPISVLIVEALAGAGGGFAAAKFFHRRGLVIGAVCALIVWLILLLGGGEGISPVLSLLALAAGGGCGGLIGRD